MVRSDEPLPSLPPRPADGHKGTFGTVLVVGGQAVDPTMMIGGPALSALAALRTGAGLAILAMPKPTLPTALSIAPEATGLALPTDESGAIIPALAAEMLDEHLPRCRCLAVGPGLGTGEPQRQLVMRLITLDEKPVVLDADALNVMAESVDLQRDLRCSAVLTPHPGEYRRLASSLGISADPTDPSQRRDAAEALAQRLGCVVVLKGHETVVTDGLRTAINTTGNPALSTAGTGDVLTGMIAGVIAQIQDHEDAAGKAGTIGLYESARIAVHLHGLAGDQWASRHGESGLLASDLLDLIPNLMSDHRR